MDNYTFSKMCAEEKAFQHIVNISEVHINAVLFTNETYAMQNSTAQNPWPTD